MEPGIGWSAEGALCDCDRVGERCQCVEYGQRVERGWIGVKWELMNCDGWGKLRWVGGLAAEGGRGGSFVDDTQKGKGNGKGNGKGKTNSRSLRDDKQKKRQRQKQRRRQIRDGMTNQKAWATTEKLVDLRVGVP